MLRLMPSRTRGRRLTLPRLKVRPNTANLLREVIELSLIVRKDLQSC